MDEKGKQGCKGHGAFLASWSKTMTLYSNQGTTRMQWVAVFLVTAWIGAPANGLAETSHGDFVNYALVNRAVMSGWTMAPAPPHGVWEGGAAQSSDRPLMPNATTGGKKAGWARRHALLLTGLAITGGGAALLATGGPGQASGCLNAGPYGQLECTTVTTWGASGQHIAGILITGLGATPMFWGMLRHP